MIIVLPARSYSTDQINFKALPRKMNVTIAGIQYNQHCLDNDNFTFDLNITLSQESILNQTDSSGKVTTIFHLKKITQI